MRKFLLGITAFVALTGFTLHFAQLRVPGLVTGFRDVKKDGQVDGALVYASIRPQSLLAFDLSSLLGPNEEMQAGPQKAKVPGNFFFPHQSENWGFIPITLSKENFGFYTRADAKEEAAALWIQVPFSKLLDVAQKKGPFTELLPHIKLKGAGFLKEQNWGRLGKMTMPLDRSLSPRSSYKWTRSAAPALSADLVLNFQASEENRWVITELKGAPAERGALNSMNGLASEQKTFFARFYNKQGAQKPYAMTAHVVSSRVGEAVEANSLPRLLEGVALSANRRELRWKPLNQAGWMMVVSEKKSKVNHGTQASEPAKLDFSFGMNASKAEEIKSYWVKPQKGVLEFDSALGESDSLAMVFVGTDREVPEPSPEQEDPALFRFANEVRLSVIKE